MHLPNNTLLQGGKYKITRFIASGGFGCTYEAEHVMLGKRVAIKEFFVKNFCDRDEATSHITVGTQSNKPLIAKLKKKFVDEARAIGGLAHPGIVTVTDVFEENGTAYFVMGYIDGVSVADILKSNKPNPIPEAKAIKYIRQVCDALDYVHDHNRLHLDIKPANIMIDSHDNAILIDFGTSKQYEEESGENTSTLVGKTPGYAPLEQMGSNVSAFSRATDIYALGATLYKMVTGVTPPESTILASGTELPPIPESVSSNVRTAIYKAMELQKSHRPQNISEFVALIDKDDEETVVVEKLDPPISPKPEKPKQPQQPQRPKQPEEKESQSEPHEKPWLKVVAAIAVIAVVLVGLFFVFNSSTESKETAESENVVEETVQPQERYVTDKEFTNANGITFKFSGNVVGDKLPTGYGTGVYEKGTYTGDYVNGIRQGNGEFKDKKNRVFKGAFQNDQYSEGTYTYDATSYFKGTFKDDQPYNGDYYEDNQKVAIYINGKAEWPEAE